MVLLQLLALTVLSTTVCAEAQFAFPTLEIDDFLGPFGDDMHSHYSLSYQTYDFTAKNSKNSGRYTANIRVYEVGQLPVREYVFLYIGEVDVDGNQPVLYHVVTPWDRPEETVKVIVARIENNFRWVEKISAQDRRNLCNPGDDDLVQCNIVVDRLPVNVQFLTADKFSDVNVPVVAIYKRITLEKEDVPDPFPTLPPYMEVAYRPTFPEYVNNLVKRGSFDMEECLKWQKFLQELDNLKREGVFLFPITEKSEPCYWPSVPTESIVPLPIPLAYKMCAPLHQNLGQEIFMSAPLGTVVVKDKIVHINEYCNALSG